MLIAMMGVAFSCQKKAINDPLTDNTNVSPQEETLTIDSTMTLAQINAVIASASAGQTVYASAGTYKITGKIVMKAGVSIVKLTTVNPIFNATSLSSILTLSYGNECDNTLFQGITFWNIRIVYTNTKKPVIKYCIFDYAKRAAGTNKTNNLKPTVRSFRIVCSSIAPATPAGVFGRKVLPMPRS
jgi:hypothetical protein